MTHPKSHSRALAVAILSLGLPMLAAAQGTGGGTSGGSAGSPTNPAVSSPGATGQSTATTGRAPDGKPVSPQEKLFMEKAAVAGLAEVELARLAQEKGSADQVKKFAEVMVRDHGKANTELTQLAGEKGIELPLKIEGPYQQQIDKLQQLSGDEFDREYMKLMVDEHKKDVEEFERQSKQGNDILVKSFAAKNLLILQQHLKMAQTIEQNMKGTADRATKGGRS